MIQYIDKVIFPKKYILKSACGRRFNSIEEWVIFEKNKLKKYKYSHKKRFKYYLPYLDIINIDPYIDQYKIYSRESIEIMSLNRKISRLLFAKDLSSIVMQCFYDNDEMKYSWYAYIPDIVIDYDFVYGNVRLDTSLLYYTKIYQLEDSLYLTEGKYSYLIDKLMYRNDSNSILALYDSYECPIPIRYLEPLDFVRPVDINRYIMYDDYSIEYEYDADIIDAESEDQAIEIYNNRYGSDNYYHKLVKIVKVPDYKWLYYHKNDNN